MKVRRGRHGLLQQALWLAHCSFNCQCWWACEPAPAMALYAVLDKKWLQWLWIALEGAVVGTSFG
jgi:hypothetical protein